MKGHSEGAGQHNSRKALEGRHSGDGLDAAERDKVSSIPRAAAPATIANTLVLSDSAFFLSMEMKDLSNNHLCDPSVTHMRDEL